MYVQDYGYRIISVSYTHLPYMHFTSTLVTGQKVDFQYQIGDDSLLSEDRSARYVIMSVDPVSYTHL